MDKDTFIFTGNPYLGSGLRVGDAGKVSIDLRTIAFVYNYKVGAYSIAKVTTWAGATQDILEEEPFEVLEAWKTTLVEDED